MKTFEELDLIPEVKRALTEEKYLTPTPIQAQTIPATLSGRDILGCAQTGTGKTAAFALPILNDLGLKKRKAAPNAPLVLVLAPTRELAIQIDESFATYGRHLHLRQALIYGGVKQGKQVLALDRGAHVVVATPGRLLDLMNQGHVQLDRLEYFVLDEADRMLDMGFLPDLKRIISQLPRRRQSLFFSATLPPNIVQLSQRLLTDPVSVNVTPKETSVERIQQGVIFVEKGDKQRLLRDVINSPEVYRAIVFTRTKRGANSVAEKLSKSGIPAVAIHGNKSQNARQRALEDFRRNRVKVLVATDLAARGIDIDGVTHVINYEMPIEAESYVHRIGRTGRAGAEGIAYSFCASGEMEELRAIERLIGIRIPAYRQDLQPEPTRSGSAVRVENSQSSSGSSQTSSYRPQPSESSRGSSDRAASPYGARRERPVRGGADASSDSNRPRRGRKITPETQFSEPRSKNVWENRDMSASGNSRRPAATGSGQRLPSDNRSSSSRSSDGYSNGRPNVSSTGNRDSRPNTGSSGGERSERAWQFVEQDSANRSPSRSARPAENRNPYGRSPQRSSEQPAGSRSGQAGSTGQSQPRTGERLASPNRPRRFEDASENGTRSGESRGRSDASASRPYRSDRPTQGRPAEGGSGGRSTNSDRSVNRSVSPNPYGGGRSNRSQASAGSDRRPAGRTSERSFGARSSNDTQSSSQTGTIHAADNPSSTQPKRAAGRGRPGENGKPAFRRAR